MRILAAIALLGVLLAGCNTIGGFGRDISAVGDALTDASQEASKPAPRSKKAKSATAKKEAPSGQPGARRP